MKEEKRLPLAIAFLLGAVAVWAQGIFPLPCLAFAPWIALVILRTSHLSALWLSALAGALFDLFTDDPMGIHALGYTLTTFLLFPARSYLLFERPLHLSLFAAVTSWVLSHLHWLLLFLFDRRVPFPREWILLDWIGMASLDALYALVWFTAPLLLLESLRRQWVLFWLKRKNPSLS